MLTDSEAGHKAAYCRSRNNITNVTKKATSSNQIVRLRSIRLSARSGAL